MSEWRWIRVTRKEPCPVCGHDSYCTICPDLKLVLCMRESSDRPSKNQMGGWLHPLNGEFKVRAPRTEAITAPSIDAAGLMREFQNETDPSDLIRFADSIGVRVDSLRQLGCARAERYRAWAFPMSNGSGRIVGIRLRSDNGKKFAVTGSHQGIFLPHTQPAKFAWIVEGATDIAALLSLGLWGIGRPQCSGCIATLTATIARLEIREAVIVADSDEPGVKGAETLSHELDIPHRVYIPPAKDLRQLMSFGADRNFLMSSLKELVYRVPARKKENHVQPGCILQST